MTEQPCVLCLVAQGKIQAQKVLESDRTIAVMNTREPQARGHIVIFPKHHATALHEMDPEDLSEVAAVARALANAQGLENYNLLHNAGALAGQTVFHAHFHLIPKWSEQEGFRYTWKTDGGFNQQESYLKIKETLAASSDGHGLGGVRTANRQRDRGAGSGKRTGGLDTDA